MFLLSFARDNLFTRQCRNPYFQIICFILTLLKYIFRLLQFVMLTEKIISKLLVKYVWNNYIYY